MPAASGNQPLELSIDQRSLQAVARLLRDEADGKTLRKQLTKDLRATATPVVNELKASIRSAPSSGGPRDGQPLRQAIAAQVKPVIRLTGKNTGASIQAKKTPNVRGFTHAAQRFNRPSFRRKVYGKRWTTQVGKPKWFDSVTAQSRDDFRDDVLKAVKDLADTLAARARSRT